MKNTVVTFQEAKDKGEKLSMLTAYDYSTARLIDEAGVNAILVGDSLGMVVLGYEDTSLQFLDFLDITPSENCCSASISNSYIIS